MSKAARFEIVRVSNGYILHASIGDQQGPAIVENKIDAVVEHVLAWSENEVASGDPP